MKIKMTAALVAGILGVSCIAASAQSGPDILPISRNYRGEAACPSNYVIRGNACVSIYAGRGGFGDEEYGRRDRRYYGDQGRRGGDILQPRVNRRGELQCPSNYVIEDGECVNLYGGRFR
ncbi:hypothetical protein AB8B21_03155 [Tardiphaga sp. 866_E4_N2_1]|uniref:hypothetical protein n=1 Tax=unclassified Tardiphaga TaxID=2631404 RepID=UPI003F2422D0